MPEDGPDCTHSLPDSAEMTGFEVLSNQRAPIFGSCFGGLKVQRRFPLRVF